MCVWGEQRARRERAAGWRKFVRPSQSSRIDHDENRPRESFYPSSGFSNCITKYFLESHIFYVPCDDGFVEVTLSRALPRAEDESAARRCSARGASLAVVCSRLARQKRFINVAVNLYTPYGVDSTVGNGPLRVAESKWGGDLTLWRCADSALLGRARVVNARCDEICTASSIKYFCAYFCTAAEMARRRKTGSSSLLHPRMRVACCHVASRTLDFSCRERLLLRTLRPLTH
jgi:hypothetical protein